MTDKDERTDGLTPMDETPRTGGNPQGIADSVATPPNGDNGAERDARESPAPTETATGGLLSRLASVPAASFTPNAPTETLAPNAPGSGPERPAASGPSAPTEQGLVDSYLNRLTGAGTPQDEARTNQYRQMFEAARRGAARNPADAYNATRERALRTAMGQAVRQTAVAPAAPVSVAPIIRKNLDGTTTTVGTVNGEDVDYGEMSPQEAAGAQTMLADMQGILDDFYVKDFDFMTNV